MNAQAPLREPVAVIAMAGRFPGPGSLEMLWDMVLAGENAFAPRATCDLTDAFTDDQRGDAHFVPSRPALADIGQFDAGFFGMTPREAALTDPQHRIFLEICWEALESAGIDPFAAAGRIGVFAGCSMPTYLMANVLQDRRAVEAFASGYQVDGMQELLGSLNDTLATRVAYRLDLRGPAFSVQSACSTSLLAVAQAVQSIRAGACDAALAGGVSISVPQERGYMHQEGGMVSGDGVCRPFDASASGTVFANGAGVVLLKRLDYARRDGDTVLAVIRGVGVNNDGRMKAGFTAPRVEGQTDAIRLAQRDAQVEPAEISYVECHGTATPLGDPIEFAGLQAAFGTAAKGAAPCTLGSLKGTLGHMDAAAGVCGLIKTVLALRAGVLPPMPGFSQANPGIDLSDGRFAIPQSAAEWPQWRGPRLAGISSFGVGGTNVHLVIAEAPGEFPALAQGDPLQAAAPAGDENPLIHLPLSARDDAALVQMRQRLATHLAAHPDLPLAGVARTLQDRRHAFPIRSAIVACSVADAVAQLSAPPSPSSNGRDAPPVVFMFPGQGAQYPGMARALYKSSPIFARLIDRGAALCAPTLGCDLHDNLCHDAAGAGADAALDMRQTRIAQPCLFIFEVALAQLWISRGLRPDAMIGHSVGEFAAATIAGAMSFEDGLTLVMRRGELMQAQAQGSMISARAPAPELALHLAPGAEIAAMNAPGLNVIAGPPEAIAQTVANLTRAGIAYSALDTSHAFHSAMMDDVVGPMETLAAGLRFAPTEIPIVSTATGAWHNDAQIADPAYWASHCRQPVLFQLALQTLCAGQVPLLIEVGPGRALCTFARQSLDRAEVAGVVQSVPGSGDDTAPLRMFEAAHGTCWSHGVEIDWPRISDRTQGRIALPTYPFQRALHWIDAPLPLSRNGGQEATPALATPAPPPMAATAESPPDRLAQIEVDLLDLLGTLSGQAMGSADRRATFLDLGFESLFLGQFARQIEKRFAVTVAFRDLLRDVPCIADLAARIEAEAPQSARPKTAPATPPPPSIGAPRIRLPGRGAPLPAAGLTEAKRAFIVAMVADYAAHAPRSKALADANRGQLADPRTAAGFSDLWKEMVFPVVCDRSDGAYLIDIDANTYVDLVNGYGQTAFGHAPRFVTDAIREQLDRGFAIGPQTALAGEVAGLICKVTGLSRVTFCNTGSEAVMAAMRVARTVTGSDRIVSFSQAYHGQFDEVLVRAGPASTLPAAPGIPAASVENMTVLPYSAPESLDWIRANADQIAGVIVEPVQSRHPELRPQAFVQELRDLATQHGFALVFDEVVTGFRVHPGGMQAVWDIRADMATYGKVLGGGMPIGVLAGAARFMDALDGGTWQFGDASAPTVAPTFFAGTFVRHPLVLAAARAVLHHIAGPGAALYDTVAARTEGLVAEIRSDLAQRGIHNAVEGYKSWFACNFSGQDPLGTLMFAQLRLRGIHVQDGYPCFLTTAHTEADYQSIAQGFRDSADALQSVGILAPVAAPLPELAPGKAPLTAAQREIWLAAQAGDAASCAFNESVALHLNGPLDSFLFLGAVASVFARHDALQARFSRDGATFELTPEFGFTSRSVDLSADDDPQAAFAALLKADARTPFDLILGPLARGCLVRLGPSSHTFVLTAHHIVCDGWSLNIVLDELAAIYRANLAGEPAELEPAASFIAHANRATCSAQQKETLRFWAQHLADPPPLPDLPLDRAHTDTRSYAGGTRSGLIAPEVAKGLKAAGARAGATLFSTCLALVQVMVARLSGSTDIIVAIPSAGQADQTGGPLVGHCVNLLPMRGQVRFDAPFGDHAGAMQDAVSAAYDHRDVTYGTLVEQLGIPRTPHRLPLTEIQFNLERWSADCDFGPMTAQVASCPKAFSNFDAFFNLTEGAQGIRIDVDYNADVLNPETVDRWIGHLITLAAGAAANAATTAGRLALHDIGPAPRRPAGALVEVPSFLPLFDAHVAATPDAVAVVHGPDTLTYAALDARANRLAHHIMALCPRGGARIAVLMQRSVDMPAALLAIAKAGGTWVPLDPAHPAARLGQTLMAARPEAVICDGPGFADIIPDGCAIIDLGRDGAEIARHPASPLPNPAAAAAPAYVVFTSGSTGTPKGVVVSYAALGNLLVSMQQRPGCGPGDTLLAVTTLSFDIAALEMLLPLISGARLVIADTGQVQDGFALVALAQSCGATILQATPTLWTMLAEAGVNLPDCTFLCGGEPLSRALANDLAGRCKALWNMYGPSETTIWSSLHRVTLGTGPVPAGDPVAQTGLWVVDAAGMLAPPGVPGELWISGAGLATGYFNDADRTTRAFVSRDIGFGQTERFFRSGDFARREADGTLVLLGRHDGQIKLRGFRIESGDVEAAVASLAAVRHCAVALIEGPGGDTRLMACIVPQDADHPPLAQDLGSGAAGLLPGYMVPTVWVFASSLPLTANGKLDRKAVAAMARAASAPLTSPSRPPQGETEQRIAAIWRTALGQDTIGAEDNIYALGADSLTIFRIAARLLEAGLRLDAADVMRHPTIAALAIRAAGAADKPVGDAPPSLRDFRHGARRQQQAGAGS